MAIAQFDYVALQRAASSGLQGYLGKPPTFGVTISAAAPWDIEWDNGQSSSGVPDSALDKVQFDFAPNVGLVTIDGADGDPNSAYYDSVILTRYTRQAAGAGVTTPYYLVKGINVDAYFEVPVANVTDIEGR